jgi:hypothetical protein
MPLCINGALLHATVFGIGAAVGAGVASTVLERKRAATAVPAPAEAATIDTAITRPTTRALQATGGVLRYGHPGEELLLHRYDKSELHNILPPTQTIFLYSTPRN